MILFLYLLEILKFTLKRCNKQQNYFKIYFAHVLDKIFHFLTQMRKLNRKTTIFYTDHTQKSLLFR